MRRRTVHSLARIGLAALGFIGLSSACRASLTIVSVVGGAPTGVNYVNFDNLAVNGVNGAPNATGGPSPNTPNSLTPGQITVAFAGTQAGAVRGSVGGVNAAPFLSNSNGTLFGDPTVSGQDATPYLTTGTGSVTLAFSGPQMYLGLLWGSVDTYNTLTFFNGATNVGSVTGSMVTTMADGNQGASGTFYVNINSDLVFNRVVATSTANAFEFDNVAYNATQVAVPEPSTLLGAGVAAVMGLGYGWARRRRAS